MEGKHTLLVKHIHVYVLEGKGRGREGMKGKGRKTTLPRYKRFIKIPMVGVI